MKELSIEEKARRYDKAIEIAKDINNEQRAQPFNVMTRVFPELAESEDERIKKWIIGVLSTYEHDRDLRNAAISWLEKQGEQKSEIDQHSLPVSDDSSLPTFDESIYHPCTEKVYEQKSSEWSEDDETTRNNISHIIRQYDKISKRNNQPCWYVGDCLLWMQNIKERVQPQPKQEWSKEDEEILQNILECLRHGWLPTDILKYESWLKSLRPQPQWKPSDEQMENLSRAVNGGSYRTSLLMELYQDLKKLK